MRRKDPLKRAFWLGGFVIFLVLLWGLTLFLDLTRRKLELSSLEGKWKTMEKAVKQVEENRRRAAEVEQKLSALSQFTTNRFLWANALNALQQTWVENIQLVRFKSEQTYTQIEPPKPPPGPTGAPAKPAAAKPASAVEKIVVHLEGRDSSARPGDQVPACKAALAGFPFFQEHLQKTNSVLLTSLSAPLAETSKKAAYVLFGLQLNLQEKERRLYE